jgi:hypothetical protein
MIELYTSAGEQPSRLYVVTLPSKTAHPLIIELATGENWTSALTNEEIWSFASRNLMRRIL